eukprot:jgi/Orpsp1_1/1174108/evm.model.c7180000048955.1
MVHTFTSSDSLDISSVEGYIINSICENENETIPNIQLPIEGSVTFNYSKLISVINKLQNKDNNFSDDEIDKIYEEGKSILNMCGYSYNMDNLKE